MEFCLVDEMLELRPTVSGLFILAQPRINGIDWDVKAS
jgi:hypothetical protein